jgi:hypothetical protein
MTVAIVAALRQNLEKPKKTRVWRRLVAATEILGYGLSRLEEKVYQAWWEAIIEKREQMLLEPEDDGSFTWDGMTVKEEKLCIWVADRIMNMPISGAANALKKFRIMLDPPMDLVHKVACHLLEKSVRPKDYVHTWVYLCKSSTMSLPWLLKRLFEVTFCEKELRTEFRRRGGRCLSLKLSEAEIPVETLARYCGRFLKLGFEFGEDVRELLSKKFEDEPDVRKCAHALTILKETQVFAREDFKGWYHKDGARFKTEILEEAMSQPLDTPVISVEQQAQMKISDKKRLIGPIQAAKAGDADWRSKADEWILEAKERHKQAFESLEREWIEWRSSRLRKTPRESGTIEILCNCPGTMRVLGFNCGTPYRPEILWTEIQSWLQEYGEDVSRIESYTVWDEDGQVDRKTQKLPTDGERFAFLLNWEGKVDIETFKPMESDSKVQRFIRRTRWRRRKSIYDVQLWTGED